MARAERTETLVNNLVNCQSLNVNCIVVTHVPFIASQPHKKSIRPIVKAITYVRGGSCVDQLSSVQPVTSVHSFAQNLPVWAKLNQF